MSRYLDLARKGSCELAKREKCELVATSPHKLAPSQPDAATNSPNSQFARSQSRPYVRVLTALEARCPEHVGPDRWQEAIADGKLFLATWGEQAEGLGWDSRDLFGLHTPPEHPHHSYRRLSRYDATGLCWLLQGKEVIALTADTATIRNPVAGTITTYRRYNKPGYGPVGDSLKDFK